MRSLLLLLAPLTQDPATPLRVDPLLLAEAAEVWSVIGGDDDPVWPGWDARDTPLLFYFPGVQEVLIGHPAPPEGFVPYVGPLSFPSGAILVREGETHFAIDGQNTSTEIGGVPTLVVADTLSNRRQAIELLLEGPAPEREHLLRLEDLAGDPYDQLGLIVHEAFHVFQGAWGAAKVGNEMALLTYPTLSVDNNVGFALEARALEAALRAQGEDELYEAALRFLAVRHHRRAGLDATAIAYEDGTEFNEGLARYVEWRLLEVLEGRSPGPAMAWVRGFHGYDDLSAERDERIGSLVSSLTGEMIVNNDPYGAAGVRTRFYWSGMALGAILDRLLPEWKERIRAPEATLTGLLESVLLPSSDDLAQAWEQACDSPDQAELVRAKERLRDEGLASAERRVQAILEGPGTLLTVDYSALGAPPMGWSFTPFGITAVDASRTIYSMIPVGVRLSDGGEVRQTRAAPLLHDASAGTFCFRLPGTLDEGDLARALGLAALPTEPVEGLELELEGVRAKLARARVQLAPSGVVLQVLP